MCTVESIGKYNSIYMQAEMYLATIRPSTFDLELDIVSEEKITVADCESLTIDLFQVYIHCSCYI